MFRCFNLFIGKFKRNKIIEESIEKEVDKIIENQPPELSQPNSSVF